MNLIVCKAEKMDKARIEAYKPIMKADWNISEDVTEADIREAIAQVQQKDFGVVDDDMLKGVVGGHYGVSTGLEECPKRPGNAHSFIETGNRRPGSIIGWIDDVEYKCKYCGEKYWGFF